MLDKSRWARMSATRSIMIGDIRVSYVPDGLVQMHPRWLGGSAAQEFAAGTGCLDGDGYLAGSVGGLLVENGDRRMLIDAGFGGQRVPAEFMPDGLGQIEGGRLIEGLRELGVAPGAIEVVAFTHLHDDHIGWAARGTPDGREVFGGAQFFAGEPEWRWWSGAVDPRRAALLGRRMNAAADGREIFPGVTAWSTPGHTPGHTAYVVASGGRRLIAFGDVMHSPIQFADPRWGAANDFDRTRSVASRQAVIAELSDEKATGFGGHFADVVFGRLTAAPGTRTAWEPVDAAD